MALCLPEMCFWPATTRQNLEFFEMHTCLWPGAQLGFRHKWWKLVTASLLLHCNDWYSCPRYWNEFFFSCVSCFRLKFSRFALWRKRLQLDSRSDLATNGPILGFLSSKMASFYDFISLWSQIRKDCSIVISFWRHHYFSMFSLRGILVCSLKMPVIFAVGFCNIEW